MTQQESAKDGQDGPKIVKILKPVALVVVAVAIFGAGVGFGNGSIQLGSPAEHANKDLPADLEYESVEQVYDLLKSNYDGRLDATKLLDGLKHGLAEAAGDPYTAYFSKDEAKEFNDQLNGSFTGIGAELGQDADSNLIIVSPIDGFPASKAGLRPQDIIVSINGTSTNGMSVDKAVSLIRGKADTKVTLRILRDKTEDLSFTITRAAITIPSVKWELLDGQVGLITVSQFGEDTVSLMNEAGLELKDQGATSILLDLRGNPGGLLSSAVNMSDMWLPKGKTIVQEKRGGVVTETYASAGGGLFNGMPTAVLINAGSASASEIVAGALRDNGAATLFGEKSYGKGSVQEIRELPNGTEIKITVARWYRPNGQNIDKKGIKPDHEIKMTDDDYKNDRDPQKDAAIDFLKK
ncbi:MAG TPA: S41 family peptidase [Candidatus Saccharimonadales bacterium]|nr:S41 family peptidase [Candidatus Saccharimonadales bacterium]